MTDLERIKQEKRHSETELYKIHLYKNGDWWRATEWSAYLCQFCQNSDDGKKLGNYILLGTKAYNGHHLD